MNNFADQRTASLRIKGRRVEHGLNQAQMAERLGISRASYIKHEKNPYGINIRQLEAIARVLECSVSDFIMAD